MRSFADLLRRAAWLLRRRLTWCVVARKLYGTTTSIRYTHKREEPVLKSSINYAKRLIRMTSLLCRGSVHWHSFKMGLRPRQIAVLAAGGGFVFCEEATEEMAFPE